MRILFISLTSETNNQDCLYRPLDVRGNAANLENRTIRFLHTDENRSQFPEEKISRFVLQIGCIPMMRKGSIVAANVNKLLIWIAAPDFM